MRITGKESATLNSQVQQSRFLGKIFVNFCTHGPSRKLILAKLSGGPVDEAGVIAGMSGSPVYIGGKLVGAVSYTLGSFPKEPIAGITPIDEMLSDIDTPSESISSIA